MIRKKGVTSIANKMRENRLRWFGHVKWRPNDALVRRSENLQNERVWDWGRPKKTWKRVIETDEFTRD